MLAVLATGCAGPERKFARGVNNTYEPIRLAEMRRSVEQNVVGRPDGFNYHLGVVQGFNRTMARAGIGIYEIITFPFPPYEPVATDYLAPLPQYPDNYHPNVFADRVFATDTYIGFSGGDVAPFVPGSRFQIFD